MEKQIEKNKDIILAVSEDEYRICPICDRQIIGYPALSRKDNKSEICSDCGQVEALEAFAKIIEEVKI